MLIKHRLGLKGPGWLQDIFPFCIGQDPFEVVGVAPCAALGAWILFRIAEKS